MFYYIVFVHKPLSFRLGNRSSLIFLGGQAIAMSHTPRESVRSLLIETKRSKIIKED